MVAPARLMVVAPGSAVIIPPPQEPTRLLGVDITRPDGSVSVNPTPVRLTVFAAGLLMVKVSAVVPLIRMLAEPKVFAMLGGATTLTVAVAVPPVPPWVEPMLPVVLTWSPPAVPVTLTEKVQLAPPARVAPSRARLLAPDAAVMVPPPQLPASPFGVATTRPAGSESLKPTPVSVVPALGLLTVKLSDVDPPTGTDAAPKNLARVGGATTVIEALLVLPVPPSVELTVVELFFTPAVAPVTLSEKVQLAVAARPAPARLTLPLPATAAMVPLPRQGP